MAFAPPKTDAEVDALSEGDFYHYMLDKDHVEWARHANRMSKLGLDKNGEECLATWFASAMMAGVDRDAEEYIRARLDAEHAEDKANQATTVHVRSFSPE